MSFQYFYDDLGQLTKVIDSTGTVIEYVYDPVGNILQIKRSSIAPGTLAIFNFTPQRGGPGQTVTIQGQAFDPAPANDTVQFNGTAATVLSASPTTLTVIVPGQATTGPISVTVAGQTATSTVNFTVLPIPVITSLSRKSALLGATFPNARFPGLTVTGLNLTDSTFALAPATNPAAATFGAPAISPAGTSATMSLNVGATVTGTFAVVATNFLGSSSVVPTPANRFTIVDPLSRADSDGDGVPDAIEAIFGTDPLDPNSFPILGSAQGQAESPAFTVLNRNASQTRATLQADSPAFIVLNGTITNKTFAAESPAFTILNSAQPNAKKTFQAESPAFTVLNSGASRPKTAFAESPAFTVENSSAAGQKPQTFAAESPLFSLLNGNTPTANSFTVESSLFSLLNSHVAGLSNEAPLAAEHFTPSTQLQKTGGAPALTSLGRKLRKTRKIKPAAAENTKTVSSTAAPDRNRDNNSSSLALPETETKSNNQGVTHVNQNR